MLLFLLQLLFLLLGSNCHPMGKREPTFHSPLEFKNIMHLVAFTWSQIPKNPENFLNHASAINSDSQSSSGARLDPAR